MILIADSGSTKTTWRFIDDERKIISFSTVGFNPFFWESKNIIKELKKRTPSAICIPMAIGMPSAIYFYGAGCSSAQRNKIISSALKKVFPKAKININHDLLGAARAVCDREKGIAAILGTGSNSCLYDGKQIIKQRGGWGYIISDEGSGAHLGKTLIQEFMTGKLPSLLSEKFHKKYNLTREKIVQSVYNKPNPNRFLASFAEFIHENIHAPYVRLLVKKCFTQFMEYHICKYKGFKELPFGCVGSVGFFFQDILKEVAGENNIRMGKIIKSPIDELVKFHLKK